ncbi:hypothetical protein CRENPOLYSF2_250007 [Crenothrix polyspora]|uniref:Uncharacterized protein n=1 Tax=Crenothrix polyspora TaxID=360316 RepID=A0A1R4H767_9GAMM|nr:hypothetical protein CRENPOLYSF2_250007 [Crenothrix polyspora]
MFVGVIDPLTCFALNMKQSAILHINGKSSTKTNNVSPILRTQGKQMEI